MGSGSTCSHGRPLYLRIELFMDPLYESSKWIDSPQQDQLLEIFFKDSPIQIDWAMHRTQKVVDDIQLILGTWAGPMQCITHIMHEMGHLAEIDDKRILKNSWGLDLPMEYISGRYSRICPVPKTYQATLRECRTIAMQWHIQNFLGIEETPREAIKALQFMPDHLNIPYTQYDANACRIASPSLSDADESRFSFLENTMLGYARGQYTFAFFLEEWKRKNDLLRRALKS